MAQVESINDERKAFNELVMAAARGATGKDRGQTPKEWRDGLSAEKKYAKEPARTPKKPTYTEIVPAAYNPTFAQVGTFTRVIEDS